MSQNDVRLMPGIVIGEVGVVRVSGRGADMCTGTAGTQG